MWRSPLMSLVTSKQLSNVNMRKQGNSKASNARDWRVPLIRFAGGWMQLTSTN
jgi:hypothetical protein